MLPEQLVRNRIILEKYIPQEAAALVAEWIYRYDFKLKIKRSRSTKYGDYRPPLPGKNHQITVNNDLNRFSFLLTLVHEIAHLTAHEKFGRQAAPHGREWKHEFKILMQPFFAMQVFPEDVKAAVNRYLRNPAATSCSDLQLQRVLKRYNDSQDGLHLEDLPPGSLFEYRGRFFRKGAQRRKRFECREEQGRKTFLFSPLTPVELPENLP